MDVWVCGPDPDAPASPYQLGSAEGIEKFSTEQERQSLIEKLEEAQDWLYTDGEDVNAKEFTERLDLLKAIYDPIFFRLRELTERPIASKDAKTYLGELPQIVSDWEKNKPWIPKDRIDEIRSEAEKLKKWLEEKEAEQKKTSPFSTPTFSSDYVYEKVFDLKKKVARVNKISKPKPKVEKPPKNGTENKEEKAKTDKTTSEENSSQDEPSVEDDRTSSPEDNADPKSELKDEL